MTSVSTDRRQSVNSGAAVKVPCKAATTAAITLSGEQTVDGEALVDGDRCLVKDQASGIANGIYTVDTGTWERAVDFDGSYDAKSGTFVYVTSGSTNTGFWYITTADPITIGTTSLAFARASSVLAAVSAFVQTLLDDATAGAFVETITDALTADATPDNAADYAITFDASADTGKKVLLSNLTAGPAATQAQMETGTAVNVSTTPGRQHFHPSAPKCWLYCDSAGNISASYNITSISDAATGVVDVTVATDFSNENWASVVSASAADTAPRLCVVSTTSAKTAGTVRINCFNEGTTLTDPVNYSMVGLGDQA